jgi:hypothetical protein
MDGQIDRLDFWRKSGRDQVGKVRKTDRQIFIDRHIDRWTGGQIDR